MSRTKIGTWPLWSCVTRITVSPSAPVRLVQYIGSWVGEGHGSAL
jgi:hypothetical protein